MLHSCLGAGLFCLSKVGIATTGRRVRQTDDTGERSIGGSSIYVYIGQDKDPNAEITVGMSSDEPEPVDCKELLKKTFARELDFDW